MGGVSWLLRLLLRDDVCYILSHYTVHTNDKPLGQVGVYTILPSLLSEETLTMPWPHLMSTDKEVSSPQGRKVSTLNNNKIYPPRVRAFSIKTGFTGD